VQTLETTPARYDLIVERSAIMFTNQGVFRLCELLIQRQGVGRPGALWPAARPAGEDGASLVLAPSERFTSL